MKVQKRNSTLVDFDKNSIIRAIEKAMLETKEGIDTKLSHDIANKIESIGLEVFSVENIQDFVEDMLMESNRKDVAKRYIIYRNQREKSRKNKIKGLLSEEFMSKYKHLPSPMKQLGSFVYYRTYSRYLPEEQRREYWWETVKRAVEYNCSLVPTTKEEAEKLYDNIFYLRQFLSGRTFWVGGTEVASKYPCSNFNCAFVIIDNIKSFEELFYLLMVGTGVGVRVLKDDVSKLPKIKNNIDIIHKEYNPLPQKNREDYTSLKFKKDIATIVVGDSKEGWSKALFYYLELLTNSYYENIKLIVFDYDNVRPKGERLKTFGGTASGHESIKNMFKKIHIIIKNSGKKISTLNCLDIANIIGENVVVGGVRRTAENGLIDHDDEELINAKNNLYIQLDGEWIENKEISHRKMSNNSIFYTKKPSREKLHWQIEKMRYSGEPAFANAEAASKRRNNFEGLNPCFEVLLRSKGLCNLITLNVMGFVFNGKLNLDMLLEAQKLSARAGYRMTCVDLELHEWDLVQKEDRLLGCSLTGWQDMVNATNISIEEQKEILTKLKEVAIEESKKYSYQLNMKEPLLVTTVKPEGTLSLLPGVSSGVHYSHSPFYVRRIRINSDDPLVKVCEELSYPVFEDGINTKVIEFPVKSPKGKTKYDVSAIEQLEIYKMFQECYVQHNTSITIHVKENEWDEVEQWLWDNWDDVIGVSFLSLSDSFYPLMPYEAITEEEYNKRVKEMNPFIPSLLSKYEKEEVELDIGNDGCSSGSCPVR